MERKKVLVVFGDILGFGAWSRRATNTAEIRDPFVISFYHEVERFLDDRPNFYAKYLGDGFMFIKELPEKPNSKCVSIMITDLVHLTKRIVYLIKNCPYPPPEGFRMRIAAGHATKFLVIDPNDKTRKVPEYVAYVVNLTQRLLEISPEIPFICHESTIKILGNQKKKFRIKYMGPHTKQNPRGVDSEDIDGLSVIQL